MEESWYSVLATSPFLVDEENDASYGSAGGAPTGFGQPATNNWKGVGVFSISSYKGYFDVDTDEVMHRVISSFNPAPGNFFNKIDVSPDLYGYNWITTTLVFMLGVFGNLMQKHTSWRFDVGYVNAAAFGIYGYALVVPIAFYLLLRYIGSNPSLIRFWCMWGYSLSIFVPTALLLLVPLEIVRWIIILIAGSVSSCFVALNLRSYFGGSSDVTMMSVANGPCNLYQTCLLSINLKSKLCFWEWLYKKRFLTELVNLKHETHFVFGVD